MPHLIYFDSPECPTGLAMELGRLAIEHTSSAATFISIPVHLTNPEACLFINRSIGTEAVVIIAAGSRCLDLPLIARAQGAAHRPIIAYSLINPIFPTSTDQWPQAPVTVYLPREQDPDRLVSLRGYHIEHFSHVTLLANLIVEQALSAQ